MNPGLQAPCVFDRLTPRRMDPGEGAPRALDEPRGAEPRRQANRPLCGNLRARGDSRMLDAVMRNLVDNAWKPPA